MASLLMFGCFWVLLETVDHKDTKDLDISNLAPDDKTMFWVCRVDLLLFKFICFLLIWVLYLGGYNQLNFDLAKISFNEYPSSNKSDHSKRPIPYLICSTCSDCSLSWVEGVDWWEGLIEQQTGDTSGIYMRIVTPVQLAANIIESARFTVCLTCTDHGYDCCPPSRTSPAVPLAPSLKIRRGRARGQSYRACMYFPIENTWYWQWW